MTIRPEIALHLDEDPFVIEQDHEKDYSLIRIKPSARELPVLRLFFPPGKSAEIDELVSILRDISK